MKFLIGIVAILAMTLFAAGVLASDGVTNPPAGAVGSPVLSVSYHVTNDEDSKVSGGYWALDDYIKTITVWNMTTANNYVAYIGYSGTFCTYAGAKSPAADTTQTNDGCGTMEGGRDATFTSPSGPAYTSSPGTKDFGGTKLNVLNGIAPTPWDWKGYYFPSMGGSYADTAWGWTYTLPIGATTQWVNALGGNTGDIITNAGSTNTLTATVSECTENSQCFTNYVCVSGVCTASSCGVSASGIAFGALVPGQTKGDDLSVTSTLTNSGNAPTTSLGISGTGWVGTLYSSGNTMLVGQTSWSVGSGWTALTVSNADMGTNVSPGSPLTAYFKLAVPLNQPADNYQQTITLTTGC